MKLSILNEGYPGSSTGGFRSMPYKIMPDKDDIDVDESDDVNKVEIAKTEKEIPKEPEDNLKPLTNHGPS